MAGTRQCGCGNFAQDLNEHFAIEHIVQIILKRFIAVVLLELAFLRSAEVQGTTYTTYFPVSENPISERGRWAGGSMAGGNLWGNVETTPGLAFGVSEPTQFGDPTAILNGTWGPNQTVQAQVKINTTPTGSCCKEAEVRLRTTISPNRITGYEVYCSVMPDNRYCHIASWGGPNGAWVNMDAGSPAPCLRDGDVFKGTVTGANPVTITMLINGSRVLTVKDSGAYTFSDGKRYGPWTNGNPGIGFYNSRDNKWNLFGFSGFTASDGEIAGPPMNPHSRCRGDFVEILDLKGRILSRSYGNRNIGTFPADQLCAPGVYMLKVVSGVNCTIQLFFLDNSGWKYLYFFSKRIRLQTMKVESRGKLSVCKDTLFFQPLLAGKSKPL